MISLESRPIRYFVAVIETGSFKLAAERECVSQPAISNAIQQLETKLDVKLLDRSSQGIKQTAFGEVLYERAKTAGAELQMALDEIKLLRGTGKGRLNIGAGPGVVGGLLTEVAIQCHKNSPGLHLSVTEGMEKPLIDAIAKGDLDLAVCSLPPEIDHVNLKHEVLYENPIFPVVRSEHPLAKQEIVSISELTHYPWVLADPKLEPKGFEFYRNSLGQLSEHIIETNSALFMKALVQQSDFVTFMPRTLIKLEEKTGILKPLMLPKNITGRPICIITRSRSFLSPASNRIIHELRAVCEEWGLK